MQLTRLSLVALLSSYVAAQDIDSGDIPTQCKSACESVVTLSQNCDKTDKDNSQTYLNCVCSPANSTVLIPACEACVAVFDPEDRDDNDVLDLVRACNFSRVTNTSTSTSTSTTGSTVSNPANAASTNGVRALVVGGALFLCILGLA